MTCIRKKLIAQPTQNVVEVADAKAYLRVDETAEDTRILGMIKAATSRLESAADLYFLPQTWEFYMDSFGSSLGGANDEWWDGTRDGSITQLQSPSRHIQLPIGPIRSVTSFITYDEEDTAYPFSSANYSVDTISQFGRLSLKLGGTWPQTILRPNNGIKITAVIGLFANTDSVFEDIKNAVLIMTAALYENRGDTQPEIPAQALMLIEPYRKFKIG